MRILREVSKIDRYLQGKMDPASRLLFEAQLLINPPLAKAVTAQRNVYKLLRKAGRREMKSELEVMHRRLFNDPSRTAYCKEIIKLFSKS